MRVDGGGRGGGGVWGEGGGCEVEKGGSAGRA